MTLDRTEGLRKKFDFILAEKECEEEEEGGEVRCICMRVVRLWRESSCPEVRRKVEIVRSIGAIGDETGRNFPHVSTSRKKRFRLYSQFSLDLDQKVRH